MANQPLGGRPLPFKIPAGIDALKARDAQFWQAHAAWRVAETDFEAWAEMPDECEVAQRLFDRATLLRDAMLTTPIRTGAALAMKLEAVREGDWGGLLCLLPGDLTVADMIEADVGRIAKFEMFGADAFEDMAQG
ncbi:hypothetical protein [Erythrobacter aurantius]|uniref:hypothetical protein n=1 Tax=Erythrobacter aurantius TaxID=2909249 RepID=UPI00207ADAAB|nr:hypothetical protein [Erythrobacter aurantius]